ncbi:MAG: helix-turn-helix domain-containing protein [Candidatus Onthomonas sp.]
MVTIREAAARTGLSYSCIRRLCMTNQITYVRSGKKYYINLGKLLAFLEKGHST